MTAGELMALMSNLPREAKVKAYDGEQYEDVTGVLFVHETGNYLIETGGPVEMAHSE